MKVAASGGSPVSLGTVDATGPIVTDATSVYVTTSTSILKITPK